MKQTDYDVIIIGAGASGLMAAWELVQAGKKVAIVEANNRIGGRIHTINNEKFSMPVELGAEFVHGKLQLTQHFLKKAGAATYKVEGEIWRKQNNSLEKGDDFIEDYKELEKKFKEVKDDIPVKNFLKKYLNAPEHEELKRSIKNYVEGYYAADTNIASTMALKEELQSSGDEQFRIEGGYEKIISYLKKKLQEKDCAVYLSAPVNKISWEKNFVTVSSSNKSFTAKKVLITVSLGVLQSEQISFSPHLPEKIKAAKSLGFGGVIKILLQFQQPFWKDEKFVQNKDLDKLGFLFSEEQVPTWWTLLPKDAAILTGWLGGPHAAKFKEAPDDDIIRASLFSLAKIFGVEVHRLQQLLITKLVINWTSNPYFCGGYSFDVVGGEEDKKILRKPVENTLFFAGEALYNGPEIGTVEAALVTGRDTAHRMISRF